MKILAAIKADLGRRYALLRRGQAFRFGPISIIRSLHLVHLLARAGRMEGGPVAVDPEAASAAGLGRAANSERRSVVFLHNSYYNFLYLARALRKRGWDAMVVTIDDPNGPDAKYFHGDDLNLFHPHLEKFQENVDKFFAEVPGRFKMVHFYGRGHMSFFPAYFDRGNQYDTLPLDFIRLRQSGVKIGYSVCGCNDGVSQSSVHAWSASACENCVWQNNAQVCSDRGNLNWGHKLQLFCDLIATEGFPGLDWQNSEKAYREPLTTAVDAEFWRPDLPIPDKYKLQRNPGELIVYHGVGNFNLRSREGRNIKGTNSVIAAIERLRSEGMNVRLEFVTDIPNSEVRYIQLQADVIVDQLNYGRYGATAREGMMLGRPTICFINKSEFGSAARLQSIESCPLVSATQENIYGVLKGLLQDPAKRREIGEASRRFAIKWHSAEACAERFEAVYDRLMLGQAPETQKSVFAAL